MSWEFMLPVKLVFGTGKHNELKKYIDEIGGKKGVLVCSRSFAKNGLAQRFVELSEGRLTEIFSDIRPNPTTDNVNDCVQLIRSINADFAVALGGGSPMDCCKAACAIAKGNDKIEAYHTMGKPVSASESVCVLAVLNI